MTQSRNRLRKDSGVGCGNKRRTGITMISDRFQGLLKESYNWSLLSSGQYRTVLDTTKATSIALRQSVLLLRNLLVWIWQFSYKDHRAHTDPHYRLDKARPEVYVFHLDRKTLPVVLTSQEVEERGNHANHQSADLVLGKKPQRSTSIWEWEKEPQYLTVATRKQESPDPQTGSISTHIIWQ